MSHRNLSVNLIVFLTATSILMLSGCTNNMFSGAGKKQTSTPKSSKQANAVYYDFEDILVPRDMKIDDSSTVVVSTPGHTSGIITLKGRVDKVSLLKFFNSNMQKDNWSMISQIRSPAATILVFQKASRCAVITIRDKEYYTYVEIGVAPSVGPSDSYSSMPSGSSGTSSYNSGSYSSGGSVNTGGGSSATGAPSTIESEENLFN